MASEAKRARVLEREQAERARAADFERPSESISIMHPTKSIALSSKFGTDKTTLAGVIQEQMIAILSRGVEADRLDKDMKKDIVKILNTTFADFYFCDLEPTKSLHMRIVARNVIADRAYHPQCEACPADGKPSFAFELHDPIRTWGDLLALREQWQLAAKELKRVNDKLGTVDVRLKRSSPDDRTPARRAESDAWMQYAVAAFDYVRYKVIRVYQNIEQAGDNFANYTSYLATFENDWWARACLENAPQLWCFKHSQVGKLLPTRGRNGHDNSCFICIVKTAMPAQPINSNNYLTQATFAKYTGTSS